MHRIDNATAATSLPVPAAVGPKPNSFFTKGNPGGGTPATVVDDDWANALQEELCDVIESSGITLSKTDRTQLKQAINRMIVGGDYKASVKVASTTAINLAAPGASIDGISMVAGDRFLEKDHGTAASRGIYVWNGAAVAATRATDADTGAELNSGAIVAVEQGTVNGDSLWMLTTDGTITIGSTGLTFVRKDMTGLVLADFTGSNQSLATSGYQKLPGGLILQWGQTANIAAGATLALTFPIAFPSACRNFVAMANSVTSGLYSFSTNTKTTTGVNVVANGGNSGSGTGIDWLAIGY